MTSEAAHIIERAIRALRQSPNGLPGWWCSELADELTGALEIEMRASLAKVAR